MGYTTEFNGYVTVEPPLSTEEIEYLNKFAETRRMARTKGPYYVGGTGFRGQDNEEDVTDHNNPPEGQPGLWCQWVPTSDGTGIEWDGNEKFYNADDWMKYLIAHFIGPHPKAATELPFLTGHTVDGMIEAQGEDLDDRWCLDVTDSVVRVRQGRIVYEDGED